MHREVQAQDDKGLIFAAARRFGAGIVILGGFLFVCAGDIRYWNGWLYLASLALAILFFGMYLFLKDRELLKKRLNTREREEAQRAYVYMASLSFLTTFGVCGLDHRFGWSQVPTIAAALALAAMFAGYGLFVCTLTQNHFASRVVEIQHGQKVIDTGVYSVIRHPLYTAALIMFFASPIVLGSWYALFPMLFYLAGIVFRIRNEEEVLRGGLEGYEAYMRRVKYRLVPLVW